MPTRFSKVQWGDGLTVTPDPDDEHVIRVDGSGGPAGATGPAGPAGADGADGATGAPGPAGPGVPTGGSTGQVLEKNSGTDYDTHWATPTGGGGGSPTGSAGGILDGTYPNPGLAATVAGAGLTETADVLSVNTDGSTLEISSDTLRIKTDGVTANEIAANAVGSSELAATAVGAGSYGDSTHVATFTVDADGRLTTAGNVALAPAAITTVMVATWQGYIPAVASYGNVWRVPYLNGSPVTFTLTRAYARFETPGSASTDVRVEKSPAGAFVASTVATLTVAASSYEIQVTTSLGTVTSGQLLRVVFPGPIPAFAPLTPYTVELEGTI